MKHPKNLINGLQHHLKTSTMEDRQAWVKQIVDEGIDIKELANVFLFSSEEYALQFSWLLSDIGNYKPKVLHRILPYLFAKRENTTIKNFQYQFVKYWSIAGIPKENEAEAINLLFKWLCDSNTNVSTKAHAMLNLYELSKNYPDIKNELKTSIENQLDKTSISFRKKATKILPLL